MKPIDKIQQICNGIEYSRSVPQEAEEIASANNIVIIVGGSDDLMYCYGADCYITYRCEHGYGRGGDTLENIGGTALESEASQIGLKIWWCGEIGNSGLKIDGYSVEDSGAFSYSVNDGIEFREFKVMEDDEVYCTGIIVQLPDSFKACKPL